jgi:hypothetical protein
MRYTTVAKLEDYLLIDIDDVFEEKVNDWIDGVSRLMDQLTNRKLVAEAVDTEEHTELTTKYYDGNDKEVISIDDCVSVDSLYIGDQYGDNLTEVESFITYPKGGEEPIRKLMLKSGLFTCGIQNIKVTARFGAYAEIPADIALACTILVAGIINNQNKGPQAKKSESIGNYSVSYIDDKGIADYERALSIIESYKKFIL